MITKAFLAAAALAATTTALAQDAAPPAPPAYAANDGYYADSSAPRLPYDTYQGQDRTYYQNCKRSSGTTGLLAGAGGGGLLAGVLGASPLGIAAGVVGGGLLGRHLDKRHDEAQNENNGC